MSDLFDLFLGFVHWFLDGVLRVLGWMGLRDGLLDRLVSWLMDVADAYLAALLAAVVLLLWTVVTGGVAGWIDRRVRARVQGRTGPRAVGTGGLLQGAADWLKLFLRKRDGVPSALPAGVSGALVVAALAMLPLDGWAKLADPEWGLVAASALLALSPLPMAAAAPAGRRHAELAEGVGTGAVMILAVASMLLVAGTGSTVGMVELQEGSGWGLLLSPLGFLLIMAVMAWESDRLVRARASGITRRSWPGPHKAVGLFTVAARYYALSVLATLVFLGGWSGPLADGAWWTLVKAFVLVAFTSMVAGALPLGRPMERAGAVRTRYLPLATLNLVVVALLLEVVA